MRSVERVCEGLLARAVLLKPSLRLQALERGSLQGDNASRVCLFEFQLTHSFGQPLRGPVSAVVVRRVIDECIQFLLCLRRACPNLRETGSRRRERQFGHRDRAQARVHRG